MKTILVVLVIFLGLSLSWAYQERQRLMHNGLTDENRRELYLTILEKHDAEIQRLNKIVVAMGKELDAMGREMEAVDRYHMIKQAEFKCRTTSAGYICGQQ